ncbi:MAG: biopolymer transporter ExbD [Bacteroidetes bacterium]|nr:biopolymer transporter ExbD [Bacteroidota bacterium]MDA0875197.1 biopolymer transporter ExbD [Bacteroidota bacterium]
MAINFSTERKLLISFSQAGLADIVLLLLIFFLLTSNFIPQFGIQVTLPRTQAASPTAGQFVSVAVTANGTFYVEQQQVPREQLIPAIQDVLGGRTALVLRADENALVKHMADVANAARALNLRVLMATDQRGGPN